MELEQGIWKETGVGESPHAVLTPSMGPAACPWVLSFPRTLGWVGRGMESESTPDRVLL